MLMTHDGNRRHFHVQTESPISKQGYVGLASATPSRHESEGLAWEAV